MLGNIWMVSCLAFGCVLTVALVASIPIYTHGILQRLLVKDLERLQLESGIFPGRFGISADIRDRSSAGDSQELLQTLTRALAPQRVADAIGASLLAHSQGLARGYLTAVPLVQREERPVNRLVTIEALTGFADHVSVTQGRLFSAEHETGVLEAVVTEQAIRDLDLILGETYTIADITSLIKVPLTVKIVGVFAVADSRDPYWDGDLGAYRQSLLIDYDRFVRELVSRQPTLYLQARWHWAFDYREFRLTGVRGLLSSFAAQQRWLRRQGVGSVDAPALPILREYLGREARLRITLWMLQTPVLILLAFYLLMVSRSIIEHESGEIAALQSRGAGRHWILAIYTIVSLIFAALAMIAGPPLGLVISRMLGAANGFFEFVQRTALPAALTPQTYLFSLWACLVIVITMVIPAFDAARASDVERRQRIARTWRRRDRPLWHRSFADIGMLGGAGYGLYRYRFQSDPLVVGKTGGSELAVDPLFYLIATFFILGAGMLFLRLYPMAIRLLWWVGRRVWPPALYASLMTVGRTAGGSSADTSRFLMLFLIFTLAVGIFNATSARTLNLNVEERFLYANGTDVVLQPYWEGGPLGGPVLAGAVTEEPPFVPFTELTGTAAATKVLRRGDVVVETERRVLGTRATLMGILPDEFGRTAWFRPDLLPMHWHRYLNALAREPSAALASRSLNEEFGIRLGETVRLQWGAQDPLEVTVVAFVDYWPGFNPRLRDFGGRENVLIIANLAYVQLQTSLEPYEVWIKKESRARSEAMYREIRSRGLLISELRDAGQQIVGARNDPMLQGTNGALTQGFIAALAISVVGFLVTWIISLQRRLAQFGFLRALGLSRRKVIGMLLWEQLLVSGAAIVAGIAIGALAGQQLVPLLRAVEQAADQVPPFKTTVLRSDYNRIYTAVGMMIAGAGIVLGVILSRMKIHRAIKLGDE